MISVEEYFHGWPISIGEAPGRVNLLGEHTDYNDGFVLPTAIPQHTQVSIGLSRDSDCHIYSATLDQRVIFPHRGGAPEGYARYIDGCIRILEERGYETPPLKIHVSSEVPMGAGLSSSAALEVATLRALRDLLNLNIDDVEIALIGRQAENQYAHVNCGVMDQMASSLADSRHMLFLDTRNLNRKLLPLPPDAELIIIDSGVPRRLAASKYNERRAECEAAARQLGVAALRDVGNQVRIDSLPSPLRERARHVVSENNRVLEATKNIEAEQFGSLMNESHASLRDDYEVSIPELDLLTSILREHQDVYGARLTGAGFGGACVALCRAGEAESIAQEALRAYNSRGQHGRVLTPLAGIGGSG